MIPPRTTLDFRIFFLKEFTKQLIKNSNSAAFYELQTMVKEQEKEVEEKKEEFKQEIKKIVQVKTNPEREMLKPIEFKPLPRLNVPQMPQVMQQRILRVPRPRLPAHLSYLRPTPVNEEIDLGKMNILISDPAVKEIECPGENANLYVKGDFGTKESTIVLTKDEIDLIVRTFAQKTKIPLVEGVYKVVYGNLIFSAIISDVIGTKFIIQKMITNPQFLAR